LRCSGESQLAGAQCGHGTSTASSPAVAQTVMPTPTMLATAWFIAME